MLARSQDYYRLRVRVKRHLMNSALHQCNSDEAEDLAAQMYVDVYVETKADRDAYRAEMEKKEKKEAEEARKKKNDEERRNERSRNRSRSQRRLVWRRLPDLLVPIAASAGSDASSGSAVESEAGPASAIMSLT